jgi:hypothetical protein
MNTGAVLSYNFSKPVNLDDIQTSNMPLRTGKYGAITREWN